jgi:hypothetical protein
MQSTQPVTPMEMLNTALTRGADVTVLEKLMGLQERWEANQARKAFDAAIAAAKGEIGPIVRNATGHNEKRYADFAAIARTVDPVLTKHGLTYRFRTEQTDRINVTCILSHKDGHSETTTLAGPPDGSGSKNAIQAIGSTLTYLQRYSLVQMLGLASSNDDDGRAANPPADAADLRAEGERIAKDDGLVALGEWWTKTLTAADRKTLGPAALMDLKKMAGA